MSESIQQEKALNAADAIQIAKEKGWNPVSIILSKKIYYVEPGPKTCYPWETVIFAGNPKDLTEADFEGKISKPFPKDED